MSKSAIEWTEETWNPIVGCSLKSHGCTNCYAMPMAARIEAINAALVAEGKSPQSPQYDGTTKKVNGHAVWTGKLAMAGNNVLLAPLKRKKPTTYFVNSMGDLFHEDCPDEWIDPVFAVMALTPHHIYQVLTKRPARMLDYCSRRGISGQISDQAALMLKKNGYHNFPTWPLPNVWLGVSTERQQEADERIPLLLQTPAAIRFISAEPLIGPINLTRFRCDHPAFPGEGSAQCDALIGSIYDRANFPVQASNKLDWIMVGGESGPDARPMHPDWARSLQVQCEAAGVKFFFKQWGSWMPDQPDGSALRGSMVAWPDGTVGNGHAEAHGGPGIFMFNRGKHRAGRSLDGIVYNGMPGRAA